MENTLPSGITPEQLLHLRTLLNKFEDMQLARRAFENRIQSLKDGATPVGRLGWILETERIEGIDTKLLEETVQRGAPKKVLGFRTYEDELVKQMESIVSQHKLWIEWLEGVKGIGILSAAKLIGFFEPYWAELEITLRKKKFEKGKKLDEEEFVTRKLHRPKSRSSLLKLCGYSINEETGRAYRRAKGIPIIGNPKYKKTFYILFECLLKQKGKCYELWKQYHTEIKDAYPKWLAKWYKADTREECKKLCPKVYIPNTLELSRRRFIKTFISILWES